ncbi:MAG: MerR family transcriptional regulator [Actinomycetota bacterium]|nr:MerR family transcriptional regulator [Actinomycetota bacterium]
MGEFARRSWLSTKALRLYESKHVLAPENVDPVTGYRRYGVHQLEVARLIVLLRRIEMPLSEVRRVLAATPEDRARLVKAFWARRESAHARQRSLAEFLARAVSMERLDGYGVSDGASFPVMLRDIPSQHVITRRRTATAGELTQFIRSSIDELVGHAAQAGGTAGPPFVIYHGEVSWGSDGPVEVCIPVADPDRAHRVEEAHCQAYVEVPKSRLLFPSILEAFEAVLAWPSSHNRAAIGPPREIYTTDYAVAEPGDVACYVALPVNADPA